MPPIYDVRTEDIEILVVEDSATQALKLKYLLEENGYRVKVAEDAAAALAYLTEKMPHIIISDILMPGMDGYELCRKIKDDPDLKKIPVLLLTTLSEPENIIRGLMCGAENFVTKPYNDRMLLDRIKYVLVNQEIRTQTRSDMGIEIYFAGARHFINSDRIQILDMLFSTYESVHQKTQELVRINQELKEEIAERKRSESKIRRLRNLLASIVDSMPSILVGVDAEGRVTQWNAEAEKAVGISFETAEGKLFSGLFPGFPGEADRIMKAMAEGQPGKELKVPGELGGRSGFFDITIYPLAEGGEAGAVIILDDVTERVRFDEVMVQSEKMMSVGGLAAGMAHEINDPLAAILQNLQVIRERMKKELPKNSRVAEACGTTIEAVERYLKERKIFEVIAAVMESGRSAARVVDNMLSFTGPGEAEFYTYDICRIIDDTVALAESDMELKERCGFRRIRVLRECPKDLPGVPCESRKIQQVLFNILKNAAQAMAPMENTPVIEIRVSREGELVRIEVSDNGPGMAEPVRKRVFEPFYTTRDPSDGKGLGLTVAYFIVTENHKGRMRVESAPGKGTRLIIHLPLRHR